MGPSSLVPCASCGQHVRDEETQCPFCGARRIPGAGRLPVALDARMAPLYGAPPGVMQPDLRDVAPAYGGPPRPQSGSALLWIAIAAVVLVPAMGLAALLLLR